MAFDNQWLKQIATQFVTEKEFDEIEKSSVKLKFKKGETLLKQGSLPSHVIILESGIVKFNFENESNKNLILTIAAAPKILGGANLFYSDNLFSFVAIENCEAILIDAKILFKLISNNAKLAMALLQLTSEMYKKEIMNFISLASKQKEGRIADIILYLAENVYKSKSFDLSLTRKEIAEFASCSPENVIMTLSKWQTENIINMTGKKMEITNIDKLKHISKIG